MRPPLFEQGFPNEVGDLGGGSGVAPGPHPQLLGYQSQWMLMSGRDLTPCCWGWAERAPGAGTRRQGMRRIN